MSVCLSCLSPADIIMPLVFIPLHLKEHTNVSTLRDSVRISVLGKGGSRGFIFIIDMAAANNCT